MAIAVGDIHGCLETLRRLVHRLPASEELVFLGDYIDRGPDSAGVISYLKALALERTCKFLRGNHEDMMQKAIQDSGEVASWLINGGEATLRSYGLDKASWIGGEDRGGFLDRDRKFFAALEPCHEDDEAIYVHAGVDTDIIDMKRQDPRVMMWVREKFIRSVDKWQGKMILFGHTPTHLLGLKGKSVFTAQRARGIDTGCVYGGYLTACNSKTGELYQEKSEFTY